METSTAEILRGTKYIGEWETRLTNLADIATVKNKVLLCITDIQNLHGAGRSANDDSNMADALGPFLERGDVILIGECTPESYRRGVESAPALHKQLTVFQVAPTEARETADLISYAFADLRDSVAEETGITLELPQTTLHSLAQLGAIYFPGSAQPGAAIELLRKVVELRREEFEEKPPRQKTVNLTHSDIVTALHRISGLPVAMLDDDIPMNLKGVREYFDKRVIGQSEAVTTVVDIITKIKAGLTDPGKPTAVLLFTGPTGVGKTELAKALAEFLFNDPDRMIRCDMSEYKDFSALEKLLGRPSRDDKVSGSASLVSQVRRQPFSVILLDEIEKANPHIFDVLLQAFDDGRLTDPEGNTTNLTQTIIIMTSNLGSDLSVPKPVGFEREAPDTSELVLKALRGFFKPEFLNRLDHVVRFRPLQREHIKTLARRELGQALMRNGLTRRELRVDIEPGVFDLLAKLGYDKLYGARPLRRAVEDHAVLPLARQIVHLGNTGRSSLLRLVVKGGRIVVKELLDRQKRTAQHIARGIELIDPVDGAKNKVRPADIAQALDHFAERIEALEARCAEEKIDERKSELLEQAAAIDFWDDQRTARETMGDIYRIERLIEAIAKAGEQHETLSRKFEILRDQPREAALRKLALDLRSARHFAELVRFALECRDREDRRDALVAIRLVDGAAESDLVGKLADCYLRWAQRKGYGVRVIHEEPTGKNQTRETVLEVTGPAAYGILRAEEGQHEFTFGKTGRLPRRNRFVSVRVLGAVPAQAGDQIRTRKKPVKAAARLADRIRTQVSATDARSGKNVEILSPLKPDEAGEAAVTLLKAEIERTEHAADALVRRYQMSPVAEIKDQRAPEVDVKAKDFWRGELDELLHAGIRARTESDTQKEKGARI